MPKYENIESPKVFTILSKLAADKTLVRISLENGRFESLTLVTEGPASSSNRRFGIDPPKGLIEALAETNSKMIHFEFTSSTGVVHSFDAETKHISDASIALLCPGLIQRHQQRDNFRVKAIFDSYATLATNETELRMEIDNISMGGVYCYCLNKYKSFFSVEQKYQDLSLHISTGSERVVVPIGQARVNRMEAKSRPKQFGMAFEFIRVNRDARKMLVQQIYNIQRYILQNRLKY